MFVAQTLPSEVLAPAQGAAALQIQGSWRLIRNAVWWRWVASSVLFVGLWPMQCTSAACACLTSPVLGNAQCCVVLAACMAVFSYWAYVLDITSVEQCSVLCGAWCVHVCCARHRQCWVMLDDVWCLTCAWQLWLRMLDITSAEQCSVLCGAYLRIGTVFLRVLDIVGATRSPSQKTKKQRKLLDNPFILKFKLLFGNDWCVVHQFWSLLNKEVYCWSKFRILLSLCSNVIWKKSLMWVRDVLRRESTLMMWSCDLLL